MTGATDGELDFRLGRASAKCITAAARNSALLVVWMDSLFHNSLDLEIKNVWAIRKRRPGVIIQAPLREPENHLNY